MDAGQPETEDSLRREYREMRERWASSGDVLPCPRCGGSMQAGTSWLQGRFSTFLLFGWSWQYLWFEPRDGPREEVLAPRQRPPSWRCTSCSSVLIEPGA